MRRRSVHLGFAVVATLCAGLALLQTWRMHRLTIINQSITSPPHSTSATPEPSVQWPQVSLARALAVARDGDLDRAAKELLQLTARAPADPAGKAALYDLGNLYLRRGMALTKDNLAASLPMIELAKQRYRDLLRLDPQQWDARYNLERALRLAPEAQSVFAKQGRQSETRPSLAPRDDVVAPDLP